MDTSEKRYIGGRYRIISVLGGGGIGTVFRVRDLATGKEMALKKLRAELAGTADNISCLETEFRHMATFEHKNLVRVYDFHLDPEVGTYFTMDYVDGVDIKTYLTPLDPAKLNKVVYQVCDALDYVHTRGFIHGDVKIGNILVADDRNGEPLVKLLDFGLVRAHGVELAGLWGTFNTMAPELIRGGGADARSDLYSLGIVLFTVVTNRTPFDGRDALTILRQQLTVTPPRVTSLVPELDQDLDRIITRLLEKNPSKRFYSAADLAHVFRERAGEPLEQLVTTPRLNNPNHIGRWAELNDLTESYKEIQKGQGHVVVVLGEAGSGKTRLLREFKTAIQLSGGNCHLVSCRDVPKTPFAPLRELYVQATGSINEWPADLDNTAWNSESQKEVLLNRVFEIWGERARKGSVVIIAEDIYEADNGTSEFLAYCLKILEESGIPLLFVASCREDQLVFGQAIMNLISKEHPTKAQSRVIWLRGLVESDHRLLVSEILGQTELPTQFLSKMYDVTGGNPADTIDVLQSLVSTKTLTRQGQRWVLLDQSDIWDTEFKELSATIIARLHVLPLEERDLLTRASILGERFTVEALARLVEMPAEVVRALLLQLARNGFLQRGENSFSFTRPLVRTALSDSIPDPVKIELHQQALELYQESCDDPEALLRSAEHSCHLVSLGYYKELDNVIQLLDNAAELAMNSLMFRDAQKYLDCAVSLIELQPAQQRQLDLEYHIRASRLRLAINIGDPTIVATDLKILDDLPEVLPVKNRIELYSLRTSLAITTGASDEAEHWSLQARRLLSQVDDKLMTAEITVQIGEVSKLRGKLKQAQTAYESALASFTELGDEIKIAECIMNVGRILLWTGEQEASVKYFEQARKMYRDQRNPIGECRAVLNLGVAHGHQNLFAKALELIQEALTMARRLGNRRLEGIALINAGNICTQTGDFEGASSFLQEAIELLSKLNNKLGLTITLINVGYLKAILGEFERAKKCLISAQQLAEKEGLTREVTLAKAYLGGVLFLTGELDNSIAVLQDSLANQNDFEEMHGTAEVHNWLSRIFRSQEKENLSLALTHAQKALELSQRYNNSSGIAHALTNLAATQLAMKDISSALETSELAMNSIKNQPFIDGFKEEIYFIRFRILTQAGREDDANQVLALAREELQIKADRIRDPNTRQRFLTSLPLHRRITEAVTERPQATPDSGADVLTKLIVYDGEKPTVRLTKSEIELLENELRLRTTDQLPRD